LLAWAGMVAVAAANDITAAERDRRNPVARSEEVLRAGRALWRSHCETCHGAKGKGDGPNARLHERRKGYAPRNLTDPAVQENLTDGEIFARITRGIREADSIIMPAYGTKVPAEVDRWTLVVYVRELGRAGPR
ncbi:MAG TPA: c-type cytochrome, partial [Vicinamibacteria bacterium]